MMALAVARGAVWLIPVTVALEACGVSAPPPPIQIPVPSTAAEAPTGFDDLSNGAAGDSTHQADREAFDEVEEIADGLGPLYNAQACRECHQNPTSGGASQITELRVGHLGPDGRFRDADIPIARGTVTISGRTLVNDRAICPNAAFPDSEIQEQVPDTETIRTTRASCGPPRRPPAIRCWPRPPRRAAGRNCSTQSAAPRVTFAPWSRPPPGRRSTAEPTQSRRRSVRRHSTPSAIFCCTTSARATGSSWRCRSTTGPPYTRPCGRSFRSTASAARETRCGPRRYGACACARG